MKNIWKIFRTDLHNVGTSVIGLIVVVGLVVVPCLYAWFNIAGSWDPYGNTGNLKIAVVNTDDGYESDLVPVEINVGDTVVSSLRANDSFDWIVVDDKDEAVEGVKSGSYYAAVVIPKTFSADMMTLFSTEVKHADIEFYENQKSNAIAQIVTEKGSSAVQKQVNAAFTETVNEIGLKMASNLLEYMGSDEAMNFVSNLSGSMNDAIEALQGVSTDTASLRDALSVTSTNISTAGDLLSQTDETAASAESILAEAQSGLSSIEGALGDATTTANSAISSSITSLDSISSSLDSALATGSTHVSDTVTQLQNLKAELQSEYDSTADIISNLNTWYDEHNNDTYREDPRYGLEYKIVLPQVKAMAETLSAVNESRQKLMDQLQKSSDEISTGAKSVTDAKADIDAVLADAKQNIATVKGSYETQLKTDAASLGSSISSIATSSKSISGDLSSAVNSLSGASKSLASDLNGVAKTLDTTSGTMGDAANKLIELQTKLNEALQSGDLQSIRSLIGEDPEGLADALAAPVGLDRKAIYPVENYGSAMAPFYTILSLWVGSIVLAAMMKVTLNDELFNSLIPVRLHQIYLGRYLFFGLLALMQSTLVSLGDILFFGIQCDNPFLFILGCWVASIVFSNIVYTLTVSFGDIGKALAVVLLVMQVGGSGGTFPIEMTAPFFQAVYPWLPFTHAIGALHAAVAGAYGAEFWIELGLLALYLLPSLALGILFRRPVIRANNWIIEKLEETKLM